MAKTKITPNQLTALRLATGLAAAAAFALGARDWDLAGIALFVVSMFLDRADGELARMTSKTSPSGHAFDLRADAVCNAATFLGIGIGAYGALGWLGPALGLVAGAGIVAVLSIVTRVEKARGPRAAELRGRAGFDPDDAMLIVPLAIAVDLGVALIAAAGIGAPLFAALMAWRFRT
ncbi:MAG: CDP-alcohol phosphatidyltransferase family protein [Alphaproteobacteria bacterium]